MTEIDLESERAIPWYVVKGAFENKKEHDKYAVIRSDNDYQYARTRDEANQLKADMQSAIDHVSPIPHTVAVIELTEGANAD